MTAETPDADAPHRATPRQVHIWVLTVMLGVLAAGLYAPKALADPAAALPGPEWFALVPLFALAEVWVIHLPTQRNAHGHTLREIPAVLGLTFLVPQQYVSAYVVGAVAALAIAAKMRGLKLAFNTAMFAAEASLGLLTYHAILQDGDPLTPHGWAAFFAAVLVTDLISAAAVTAAISLTEGAFDDEILREALKYGVFAAFINTSIALIVATLVIARPSALPLLGIVVALLVMAYRGYMSLARGHGRTQLLYRFVDRTAAAGSFADVVSVVVAETAELMHAERAFLIQLPEAEDGPDGALLHCHTVDDGGLQDDFVTLDQTARDSWWWAAVDGQVVRYAGRAEASSGTDPATGAVVPVEPRDGLAAPVRESGRVRAVVVVCDRSFDKETFDDGDIQVFGTLANHTGVALERARTVSHLQQLAEERAHEARHDALSGLMNRRAFNDAVANAMQEATPEGLPGSGAVLLLDLDDFKDVNDTLGHSAGDRLITVSAGRLRDHARGLVARLGGDEFAVLLPGLSLEDGLAHARELHELLCRPVPLGAVELTVSASIGVAMFHPLTESAEDLLAQADVAMYTAKADRSGVAPYRPEAGDSTARRLALAADLPAALERHDIELWFQPQAHPMTRAVTGFEALVRWNHPTFGMVPPPEIVAVAHRTGRMRALTDNLIGQALSHRADWRAAGHELAVSVNVTPRDVSDPSLVTRVAAALEETATPPSALVLEITESDAMKDPERSLKVLEDISALGVRVSVDDFGTGYSSLAYLDRLPVNEVKIDQSFVRRLERDSADSTIVRATISLAHDLGLQVVAEGVENELARTMVRELGVDLYQGFGLARPMSAGDVLAWLTRHERLLTARPDSDPRPPRVTFPHPMVTDFRHVHRA